MKIYDGCPADYWAKIVADLNLCEISLVCQRLRVISDTARQVVQANRLCSLFHGWPLIGTV